jgi:carboxymethylenebutenolidase
MIEHQVAIRTADGEMNTFVCHPERGGPHPVILFYMDAPGIREELRDMARRLATTGYYVMLPNLYYRSGVEELGPFIGDAAVATRERMMALMGSLSIPLVMSDTDALVAHGEAEAAADVRRMGAVGYCMSGQYAINAAASHKERVWAAASIYGVMLVTESPDSPHRVARETRAQLYFACAETDHWAPLDMVEQLRSELAEAKANAEVELYAGTEHGFAFPQRPVFDKAAAERHWERLHALFERNLTRA